MAIKLPYFEGNWRRLIDAINQLVDGRQNTVGSVVLDSGTAFTLVAFENCSKDGKVLLIPEDAGARAEYDPATTYVDTIDNGSFIINHPNNATLRTYGFVALGG